MINDLTQSRHSEQRIMQIQPSPAKLPKPREVLQNGWMKQMRKSYLERTTGRNRRNKKIYWTPSFMALPSMSQSHIKRDIICDDDIFQVQSHLFFAQPQFEAKKFYTWKCVNLRQKLSCNKTVCSISYCAYNFTLTCVKQYFAFQLERFSLC